MKLSSNDLQKLPRFYRRQIEQKTKNNYSSKAAYVECSVSNEPLETEKSKRLDTPVCIHIHSVRKRLADADGISGKAAIDGIVKAGLLPDDKPEFVQEVSYSQEKGDEEYTEITISEGESKCSISYV